MYTASAELYDLIYARIKNFGVEARHVARLLREFCPACRTVLDVACGTGEHARLLSAEGFVVDGIDLDPAFVAIASRKSRGRFVQADMTDFNLSRVYEAVLCLGSSIGYVRTLDRLEAAIACFRRHVSAGGVIVIEPWFPPGVLDPDRRSTLNVDGDDVHVSRSGHIAVDGRLSRLHFDYEITDPNGTRRTNEVHELGLFTTDEMVQAFRKAGLEPEYDTKGLSERGLYVARVT